jgi:hypothetical protein
LKTRFHKIWIPNGVNLWPLVSKSAFERVNLRAATRWNTIVKEFAGNPDVSFADVNLATDRITEPYNPGSGGW